MNTRLTGDDLSEPERGTSPADDVADTSMEKDRQVETAPVHRRRHSRGYRVEETVTTGLIPALPVGEMLPPDNGS